MDQDWVDEGIDLATLIREGEGECSPPTNKEVSINGSIRDK